MLHYSDQPYRFFPPQPQPWLMAGARMANRRWILPRQKLIDGIELECPGEIRRAWRRGDRILFCPNHPNHSDPNAMYEVHRQMHVRSLFMAAYDAFYSNRARRWVLRRLGVFSVDREASDKHSIHQAIQTLVEGRYALTIFPEGNVYLQNDWVTPFHEGACLVAWKAFEKIRREGSGQDVLVCPVSLKYTHLTDCRPQVHAMMRRAAEAADTGFDPDRPHAEEFRRIGAEILSKTLRQRGISVPDSQGVPLPEVIASSADSMLRSLEEKMSLSPDPSDSLVERIRAVRREVHRIRIDPRRAADHEVAAAWANEAMTAMRILSYPGRYLDHPTLDRFAETAEKLTEDIFSRMGEPYAPRHAYVRIDEPVRLSEFIEQHPGRPKDVIRTLTRYCESRVQAGIDVINEANPHPGGEDYAS